MFTGQFVVMGVCGCGKSSVASMLALRTGGVFLDADDFHPAANKRKMAGGVPLAETDRWPWLDILNAELKSHRAKGRPVFLACSALKQAYRDRLAAGVPGLRLIYLKGCKELLQRRMDARKNHFMPAALLDSQLATLEEPADAIIVGIDDSVPVIVERILAACAERRGNAPAVTQKRYSRSNLVPPMPRNGETAVTDQIVDRNTLKQVVEQAVAAQGVRDMHTHLYPPTFGTPMHQCRGPHRPGGTDAVGRGRVGHVSLPGRRGVSRRPGDGAAIRAVLENEQAQQADHIWKHLFVEHTPISEACRGMLTTLQKLGLDPNEKSLDAYRRYFAQQDPSGYIDRVMELANVSSITMTNPVFDDNEREPLAGEPAGRQ